ncbi:hypothetical protein MHYP_G00330220 [Metynnis hypsauchen]
MVRLAVPPRAPLFTLSVKRGFGSTGARETEGDPELRRLDVTSRSVSDWARAARRRGGKRSRARRGRERAPSAHKAPRAPPRRRLRERERERRSTRLKKSEGGKGAGGRDATTASRLFTPQRGGRGRRARLSLSLSLSPSHLLSPVDPQSSAPGRAGPGRAGPSSRAHGRPLQPDRLAVSAAAGEATGTAAAPMWMGAGPAAAPVTVAVAVGELLEETGALPAQTCSLERYEPEPGCPRARGHQHLGPALRDATQDV